MFSGAVAGALALAAAASVFLSGFLLTRATLADHNEWEPATPPARALIIVIDALRYDFAAPVPGSREGHHNQLTALHR